MRKQKDLRKLKVYSQNGYNYKDTPTIQLKGQWLKDLGFDSNTPIAVQCENGTRMSCGRVHPLSVKWRKALLVKQN